MEGFKWGRSSYQQCSWQKARIFNLDTQSTVALTSTVSNLRRIHQHDFKDCIKIGVNLRSLRVKVWNATKIWLIKGTKVCATHRTNVYKTSWFNLTQILWRFTISIKSSLCVMFRCWCTLLIINMIFKAFKEALSIIGLSFDCRNQSKWIEFDIW